MRPWTSDPIELFRDLVRLETELWNRLEARVHKAYGVLLARLELMQVVDVTVGCWDAHPATREEPP